MGSTLGIALTVAYYATVEAREAREAEENPRIVEYARAPFHAGDLLQWLPQAFFVHNTE